MAPRRLPDLLAGVGIRRPSVGTGGGGQLPRIEGDGALANNGTKSTRLNVLLDSGAYTAWRSGHPINLDEYCAYIERNLDWVTDYAVLDVINPKDPEAAAAASFENLKIMRARGLKPMPIYHVGEDISWLERMLDLGVDYIGLSASSLVSRNKVDDWYDMAWTHLCDPQGRPLVRAHAFGEGRLQSLERFPWFSADTASWIYSSMRTGVIPLNHKLKVSQRNDGATSRAVQDIFSLPPLEKQAFDDMMREAGVKPTAFDRVDADLGIRGGDMGSQTVRAYITALQYRRIADQVNAQCPIRHKTSSLIAQPLASLAGRTPQQIDEMRFKLVIGGNPLAMAVIAMLGWRNVLTSYAHLAGQLRVTEDKMRAFAADPRSVMQEGGWTSRSSNANVYYQILKERLIDAV